MSTPSPSPIKPSKALIWLGALLILAGIIGAAAIAIGSTIALSKTVDGFARLQMPSDESCRLIFTKPGRYTVYYEYAGTVPERDETCQPTGRDVIVDADQTPPAGLDVTLIDSAGNEITSTAATDDASISISGHAGVAVRSIVIPTAGDYTATVERGGDGTYVLAFGRGGVLSVVRNFLLAGLVGLLGFVLGLVLILVTLSKRKKAKAALASAASLPGGPWGSATTTTWPPTATPPPVSAPYGQYGTQAPYGQSGGSSTPWAPSPTPPPPPPPSDGASPWAPPPPPSS